MIPLIEIIWSGYWDLDFRKSKKRLISIYWIKCLEENYALIRDKIRLWVEE